MPAQGINEEGKEVFYMLQTVMTENKVLYLPLAASTKEEVLYLLGAGWTKGGSALPAAGRVDQRRKCSTCCG